MVKSPLVIVDEDGRRDVHGVYESEAFLDTALEKALSYLRGNIDESAARRDVEPEFFSVAFHMTDYLRAPKNAKDQVIVGRLTSPSIRRGNGHSPFVKVDLERSVRRRHVSPSQLSGHKHTVRIFNVACKRPTLLEPKTSVEATSRRKGYH